MKKTKREPDGKILWFTILFAACYLLWRRQKNAAKPKKLPRATSNPFADRSDEQMAFGFSLAALGHAVAGLDIANPFSDQAALSVINVSSGGQIEVIKESAKRQATEKLVSHVIEDKLTHVHDRFGSIRQQIQARAIKDAEEFEAFITKERELAFRRYRATELYVSLSDDELRRLITGENSLLEKIYKPTYERIKELQGNGTAK